MFPQNRLRGKKRGQSPFLLIISPHRVERTCFQEPRLLALVSTVPQYRTGSILLLSQRLIQTTGSLVRNSIHPSPQSYQSPSHFPATAYVPRGGSGWELSAKVVKQEITKRGKGKIMLEASPCNSSSKFAADYMHT